MFLFFAPCDCAFPLLEHLPENTKLTEKEAVEKAARAICWQEHKGHTGMDSPEEAWASWHANYETLAEVALKAVGHPLQGGNMTDLAACALPLK